MHKSLTLISLIIICCCATVPLYAGNYYIYWTGLAFIYIVISVGLNILTGYTGLFSLGHAGLVAIGAYATALLSKKLIMFGWMAYTGFHVFIGVAVGVIFSCLIGALLAYPSLRLKGPYLAMVTISFGWIVWKILLEWIPVTGGELGILGVPRPNLGPFVLDTTIFYYILMAFCLGSLILQRNIIKSRFGRNFMALKVSELASASLGINIYKYKVLVFVISAFFSGLGGALFAHQQNYVNPDTFHFFDSVFYLLAVLFGGSGTLFGPVIGSAVLTFLPEMLHGFDMYRLIIYGIIIIVVLYVLPRGVCGEIKRFIQRRQEINPESAFETKKESGDIKKTDRIFLVHDGESDGIILKTNQATMKFGGLVAIDGVSLDVKRGDIHSIIGPNGAGKTTLLNLISGFYEPTSGDILFEKDNTNKTNPDQLAYQGLGRTFQNVQLFTDMTVLDNVMIGFQPHFKSSLLQASFRSQKFKSEEKKFREEAIDLLEFFHIEKYKNAIASNLPYGDQRKLEIARALATRPKLLLLDEPAAGLNISEIDELYNLIKQIQKSGITVILVEHHVDLVMNISNRVSVLDYGVKIAEGSPIEIQNDKNVIEAYLGESSSNDA